MKISKVLWLKRAATAMTLSVVCLAMNSATGPDGVSGSMAGASQGSMSISDLGGGAIQTPLTEDPASVTVGANARASASLVTSQPVSVGNGLIPDVALRAYQRAATIIAASDPNCGLPWQLIAAIGRVESDHGRHGKSLLNKKGVAAPAIIGIPLDGTKRTMRIADTDAGALDGDKKFDRAVGPMQFIPSTWSVVGVDADGDARRDPQDIDDAALAAAVHLCGGNEDLSTDAGLRAAVLRYNHSDAYASLVIGLQDEYIDGNYSAPPTSKTITTPVSATMDLSTPRATPKPPAKKDPTVDSSSKKKHKVGKDGKHAKDGKKIDRVSPVKGGDKPQKPGKPGKDPVIETPGDLPSTDPSDPTDPEVPPVTCETVVTDAGPTDGETPCLCTVPTTDPTPEVTEGATGEETEVLCTWDDQTDTWLPIETEDE